MRTLRIIFSLLIISYTAFGQGPTNLSLIGTLVYPGQQLSGCWHYTSSAGLEYGLIGAANGIIITDLNGTLPSTVIQLPGVNSTWHEVKVVGDFAYAVSEGSSI
jgi:hypothetical protein